MHLPNDCARAVLNHNGALQKTPEDIDIDMPASICLWDALVRRTENLVAMFLQQALMHDMWAFSGYSYGLLTLMK